MAKLAYVELVGAFAEVGVVLLDKVPSNLVLAVVRFGGGVVGAVVVGGGNGVVCAVGFEIVRRDIVPLAVWVHVVTVDSLGSHDSEQGVIWVYVQRCATGCTIEKPRTLVGFQERAKMQMQL